MLKKIFAVFALLAVIAAGAGYFLWGNLDSIVKAGIEKYGTEVTGTGVSVGSVRISPATGEGSISNIAVKNPQNFSTLDAFNLGTISVRIDPGSLLGSGPVAIYEINIAKPQVTAEINATGTNLQIVTENARNRAKEKHNNAEPAVNTENAGKKEARKIIINDLYITDGMMTITNNIIKERTLIAHLSPIHLTDIGKETGGASPEEIARTIITAITQTAAQDISSATTNRLNSEVRKVLDKNNGDNMANKLKNILR